MATILAKDETQDSFHLYSYFRSSCSGRVRIALALKGLTDQVTFSYVNLLKSEQQDKAYTKINPSRTVPTLEIRSASHPESISIPQSIAALEFLDEAYPNTFQLLPTQDDAQKRALVRSLCAIIAADTQPPTNLRILTRVRALIPNVEGTADAGAQWAKELMADGLKAYEEECSGHAGRFSVGNNITMADVCLVPAMWGAERFGVDLEAMPNVRRVYKNLCKEEAVVWAHWRNQGDTPKELQGWKGET